MSKEATEEFLRNTHVVSSQLHKQGSEISNGLTPVEEARAQTEALPKRRDNDPTALDVILGLIDKEEDEKASEYMKGHISQEVINDTFLMDAKQQFPESTLRINCKEHNAPATFYSRQENKYQCLKCLVAREDLQYIDKKYKKQLEEFEQIKEYAVKAINENAPHIHVIAEWKAAIRDTLLKVKEKYIEWIETFTNKFVKSLNKIEHSQQLADFVGEDKRQELRLIAMQDKYKEILKIFYKIQNTKPDKKLETIEGFRSEMDQLQQYLIMKDKEMKKTTSRLNKAMRETVELDGLNQKIATKYLKYVQQKAATFPEPTLKSLSSVNEPVRPPTEESKIQSAAAQQSAYRGPMRVRPEEQDQHMNPTSTDLGSVQGHAGEQLPDAIAKSMNVRHGAQQAEQGSDQAQGFRGQPAADLNTSVMTVTSRYRHENQNSVYYLKPNSQDLYMLDFKLKGFCPEQLRWKRGNGAIPMQATSVQTMDASIYVVGGYRQSSASQDQTVLKDCLMVDANLSVYEREPMRLARYGAPLALVRDRFILAISGMKSKSASTKQCECYDTLTNHWFPISDAPAALVNTSAVVMNNRFVYVMPGSNAECQKGSSLAISVLDTGKSLDFQGDKNNRAYGRPIAEQRWSQILVSNPEFVRLMPTAAVQISSSDMLVFGGETAKAFTFDTREVHSTTKQATAQPTQGAPQHRARFAYKSDQVARQFKNLVYAIDANQMQLHVYQIKEQTFQAQGLNELGLEIN